MDGHNGEKRRFILASTISWSSCFASSHPMTSLNDLTLFSDIADLSNSFGANVLVGDDAGGAGRPGGEGSPAPTDEAEVADTAAMPLT